MMEKKGKGVFISGATKLLIIGKITLDEYKTSSYNEKLSEDMLSEKIYLQDKIDRNSKEFISNVLKANLLPGVTTMKDDSKGAKSGEPEAKNVQTGRKKSKAKQAGSVKPAGRISRRTRRSCDTAPNADTTVTRSRRSSVDSNTVQPEKPSDPIEVLQLKPKKLKLDKQELPDELVNCGECGMTISSVEHLVRHLERCRGNRRRSDSSRCTDPSEESEFMLYVTDTPDGPIIDGWSDQLPMRPPGPICPRCNFDVPTLYDLPLHQRFHTGKSQITCSICIYSTTSLTSYLHHVENHASPLSK